MTDEELAPRLDEFERRRDAMLRRLRRESTGFRADPEGAFYAFPNFSAYLGRKRRFGDTINDGSDLASYLLEKRQVAVVTGEAFGSPEIPAAILRLLAGADRRRGWIAYPGRRW